MIAVRMLKLLKDTNVFSQIHVHTQRLIDFIYIYTDIVGKSRDTVVSRVIMFIQKMLYMCDIYIYIFM